METTPGQRGQWGSKIGFILAAAGSAIGLGNIWRFPYVTGQNGGAAFVIVYLGCVILICLPYLYCELALGRQTRKNPVGAIKAITPRSLWILVGALGVITGFFILSYYAVLAGWMFAYIFKSLSPPDADSATVLADLTGNAWHVIGLFALFLVFTVMVVYGGVQKGIERWSKVLMPILFAMMVFLIIRSVTLEGSFEGLKFYLAPDFSKLTGKVVLAALGQAFYSLSLGMGLMITYGSYISKSDNLLTSGLYVAIFDTLIALLAGLMIFPAVFAMGKDPAQGTTLVFVTLPEIFRTLPAGAFIGAAFFLLMSIAALTSTISLLEVATAYFVDEFKWKRKYTVWIVGGIVFLLGIPSALSNGAVDWLTEMYDGAGFLGLMDFIWGNLSLAVGALLLCLFVGWFWGVGKALEELNQGSSLFGKPFFGLGVTWGKVWGAFIRFICPIFIAVVLVYLFIPEKEEGAAEEAKAPAAVEQVEEPE